ncbi:MAG: hypothetical protein U1F81_14655 [Verrucomicrobiaceae bacterium]
MSEFRRYFVPVAIIIVALWALWWLFASLWTCDPAKQGQLGDLFGGVNALFSGLALAGVVTAVILQSHELHLQRKELELTRHELTKSAEANRNAANALAEQISMQVQAAELMTISTLLASVNSQLGPGVTPQGTPVSTLVQARAAYHQRLHEVLQRMNKGITLPKD